MKYYQYYIISKIMKSQRKENNNYIEIELILENAMLKDLGITDEFTGRMILCLDSIEGVRHVYNEDMELVHDEVLIYLKSGDIFATKGTYEYYKKLLNVC